MFYISNYKIIQIIIINKSKIEAIALIEKIIENIIEVVYENLSLILINNRLSLILQSHY
jgi:hypothetical protein